MRKIKMGFGLCFVLVLFWTAAFGAEIECVQRGAQGTDTEYNVMKAVLDNAQTLYYLALEDSGRYLMEDVNFDGYADFVPVTAIGARNFFSLFFLFDLQTEQYEPLPGGESFCNYDLQDEKKLLVSSISDGYRDGEIKIYRWEGNTPVLLRSAKVGNLHTQEFSEKEMWERWDFAQYEMIVLDYTATTEGGQVIYQRIYPEDDPQVEIHLEDLHAALWQGL